MNKLLKLLKRYDWKNYVIYYSICILSALLIIWLLASFADILMHNTLGDRSYQYSHYNLIINSFNFLNELFGKGE